MLKFACATFRFGYGFVNMKHQNCIWIQSSDFGQTHVANLFGAVASKQMGIQWMVRTLRTVVHHRAA